MSIYGNTIEATATIAVTKTIVEWSFLKIGLAIMYINTKLIISVILVLTILYESLPKLFLRIFFMIHVFPFINFSFIVYIVLQILNNKYIMNFL